MSISKYNLPFTTNDMRHLKPYRLVQILFMSLSFYITRGCKQSINKVNIFSKKFFKVKRFVANSIIFTEPQKLRFDAA